MYILRNIRSFTIAGLLPVSLLWVAQQQHVALHDMKGMIPVPSPVVVVALEE